MGRPHLTEDDRLRVRVLRNDANFTFRRIAEITGYGERQIRNALKSPTVGKRSGRPAALSPQQQAELVCFVTASRENRSLTYAEIARALFDGVHGEYAIRNTLRRMGFKRSGPVLKQVREGERRAGGAAAGHAVDVSAEAGAGEDDSDGDEVMSGDEGHAEGQVRREEQAPAADQAHREKQPPAVDQARREEQTPAEKRIATAVAAAVNGTGPGAAASQPPETTRAVATEAPGQVRERAQTVVASEAAGQALETPQTEATPGPAGQVQTAPAEAPAEDK